MNTTENHDDTFLNSGAPGAAAKKDLSGLNNFRAFLQRWNGKVKEAAEEFWAGHELLWASILNRDLELALAHARAEDNKPEYSLR